ncbi:helix-turn-helix domain-containing protein [Rothia sp. P100]|uniref:helix-turn-helix domain-containing protein n=1 Tax=Rothia sp. P100 TaxID=2939578 RepID=UPI00203DEBCC|nr:helix-turn-helix domain-containing protein [Rothia sp. P100]MCM3509462.1 helix-turn-helix domain-containing protein [Rothia sp. P100]
MVEQRFLTLNDVSEILNISLSQTRALVRTGELKGIQIGGRNQWRVESSMLEQYIQAMYQKTEESIKTEQLDHQEA